MHNKSFKFRFIAIFCLSLLLFFSGCQSNDTSISGAQSDKTVSSTARESAEQTVIIHGIIEQKTEDQLFEQSLLIVKGIVRDGYQCLRIRSPQGTESNFTDYFVDVLECFRGQLANTTLTIRVQGGSINGTTELFDPAPSLEAGKEYFLFLYKPGRGGGFNTEGDYYYILGLTQGVFSQSSNGMLVSQSNTEMALTQLRERANTYPIDSDYFRNEYIGNQQRNLANGFITKQEYDTLISALDIYADIIS